MFYNYGCFDLRVEETMPSWVKSERMFNCDNYVKILSFFRNTKLR